MRECVASVNVGWNTIGCLMTVNGMKGLEMHTELGKVKSIKYGYGGYQDVEWGVSINFSLDGGSTGCGTFMGMWAHRSEGAQWTLADQHDRWVEVQHHLIGMCKAAGVKTIDQLEGIPVEVTFDSPYGKMQDYRILTEVL